MDLQQELERGIGHGPALPAPQERLVAGRAALRRRRVTVGAGAAAVVMAVMAPLALAGTGAPGGTGLRPAGQPPSAAATPEPFRDEKPRGESTAEPEWPRGETMAAIVDSVTGTLLIHPDARVLERRDDLYPGKDTESVALDLMLHGERQWVLLEWDERGEASVYGSPEDDLHRDFDDFVAQATSGGGMTGGPARGGGSGDDNMPVPGEVSGLTVEGERFATDGTVRILDQQPSPDLPENFASPDVDTAAAYVEQTGVRYLVLSRPGQLIVVESAGHGDSLAALLDWARERYEAEVGLL